MAAIYKRKQDQGKRPAHWYIGYTDHCGKRRTKRGFTDKTQTERLAAKIEYDEMLRSRGLIDPRQEELSRQLQSAIEDHVLAFESSLGKNSAKYVQVTIMRIRRVIARLGATTPADLSIEKVSNAITSVVAEGGLGARTHNHYVQAMRSLCNWMVLTRRLPANPLVGLELLNAATDVRHRRRALTADEIMRLVESARESGAKIQGYRPEARASAYLVAYYTGLRRKELASLTVESFSLTATTPTVRVEAACSKHRREDVLPLHPELVVLLESWLPQLKPGQPLFPKLDIKKTWLMVKFDLERAGIPYETKDGIADFHAAGRHTHITELLRNGTSLPEARELARHSDVRMTMKYTHIGLEDQARAIRNLPAASGRKATTEPGPRQSEPAREMNRNLHPDGDSENTWERAGSAPAVSGCQNVAIRGIAKNDRRSSQTVDRSSVDTENRSVTTVATKAGGRRRLRRRWIQRFSREMPEA